MKVLLPKSVRLTAYMDRYDFDFDEAVAWDESVELRNIFLFVSKEYAFKLPFELYLLIAAHFVSMPEVPLSQMYNKIGSFTQTLGFFKTEQPLLLSQDEHLTPSSIVSF
jgi:hypothetical protein